jgi:hypothetical protein
MISYKKPLAKNRKLGVDRNRYLREGVKNIQICVTSLKNIFYSKLNQASGPICRDKSAILKVILAHVFLRKILRLISSKTSPYQARLQQGSSKTKLIEVLIRKPFLGIKKLVTSSAVFPAAIQQKNDNIKNISNLGQHCTQIKKNLIYTTLYEPCTHVRQTAVWMSITLPDSEWIATHEIDQGHSMKLVHITNLYSP